MIKNKAYTYKKSLGQHFLKNDIICQKIIDYLKQNSFEQLLEVGPGGGALTKHLLQIPDINFKAIEVDKEKVDYLVASYPTLHQKLIHQDFLAAEPPFQDRFTLVGNFPYNISSQILFKALDWKEQVECIVGMFQKEVAERVAAPPGSKIYGVTSVLLQAFFTVEYLFDVPPESFTPPPKVMSGVIRLLPKKPPEMSSQRQYTILVKTAFNQRRKQLRNGVKALFEQNVLNNEIFSKRAEQLSIEDFAQLSFSMKK